MPAPIARHLLDLLQAGIAVARRSSRFGLRRVVSSVAQAPAIENLVAYGRFKQRSSGRCVLWRSLAQTYSRLPESHARRPENAPRPVSWPWPCARNGGAVSPPEFRSCRWPVPGPNLQKIGCAEIVIALHTQRCREQGLAQAKAHAHAGGKWFAKCAGVHHPIGSAIEVRALGVSSPANRSSR